MTVTDKKDDGEIELSAPPVGLPSTTATAVSNVTRLDPAMVTLIENIDVFYIQQKLQWKEGMFLDCCIDTAYSDVPSALLRTFTHAGRLLCSLFFSPCLFISFDTGLLGTTEHLYHHG